MTTVAIHLFSWSRGFETPVCTDQENYTSTMAHSWSDCQPWCQCSQRPNLGTSWAGTLLAASSCLGAGPKRVQQGHVKTWSQSWQITVSSVKHTPAHSLKHNLSAAFCPGSLSATKCVPLPPPLTIGNHCCCSNICCCYKNPFGRPRK